MRGSRKCFAVRQAGGQPKIAAGIRVASAARRDGECQVVRPVAGSTLLALLFTASPALAASTHDFSVESTIVNQCTGEAAVISLQGKVVARQKALAGTYVYTIQSQLNGSAMIEDSGTRYSLVGNEREEFESDSAAADLTLFNNARVLGSGGQSTYVGYDEQMISIDENGEIRNVTHRFDFACD